MGKRDKASTLSADWSKRERDIVIHYPNKPDGHFLHGMLSGFEPMLKERGYDISTLRFSIKKNPEHPRWAPVTASRVDEETKR